ncbi:MAG TPA: LysE family translocator [Capsulimonadaceae bacterium]|jgi:threonine/homoserine/homoserine lactone efflux protein
MVLFSIQHYLGFIAAALVVCAAPGPDNLAVLSLGISRGKRAGVGFALGCALGCLTHTLWATIGVAAVIAASPVAFTVLKFAGGAYLIVLGVKALRSPGAHIDAQTTGGGSDADTLKRYITRGFLANAINPKVALFFLAFLPQFVDRAGSVSVQMALLGLTFAVTTAVLFVTLGYCSGHIGAWLRRNESVTRWLDRATGCLFIGLGVRLAAIQQGH